MRPSAESQDFKKMEQLNSENYAQWTMDMEALLQSKGVIDFVITNYAEEVRLSNRTAEKKRELLVGDVQALGLIKMNCTPTYQRMIKSSMSSKEAWGSGSKAGRGDSFKGAKTAMFHDDEEVDKIHGPRL
jgi:hypothetical protein